MSLTFTTVIGLEIHVQLATKTKLFCGCSTDYIGAVPNTNVCPLCTGQPGTLPVLNERAVELGTRAGLALGCRINKVTRFDRKNYFYPDLPKAYQISEFYVPIAEKGSLTLVGDDGEPHRVGITRLHLEEDAGKLVHGASDGRIVGSTQSFVDYN
ncbi:MAG: Asp-tRNA(Asn)/Glu-tRNA(Gln) amidotransferase GatCAB subunit B, partial [Synergistales bacterium]|nr:Asp-tRNA(Asn)/Glu-tRNA(Gln) amidotransferase GatCAB subunit B [Synergistales bacterium]